MKLCAYCGRENTDEAIRCTECGTEEFKDSAMTDPPPANRPFILEFGPLTPEAMQKDFITLIKCRTLAEADLIVSGLQGAGIDAFIPDQFLMQAICWNLNTYGYVRVQISPKDYEAAKEFLLAPGLGA